MPQLGVRQGIHFRFIIFKGNFFRGGKKSRIWAWFSPFNLSPTQQKPALTTPNFSSNDPFFRCMPSWGGPVTPKDPFIRARKTFLPVLFCRNFLKTPAGGLLFWGQESVPFSFLDHDLNLFQVHLPGHESGAGGPPMTENNWSVFIRAPLSEVLAPGNNLPG